MKPRSLQKPCLSAVRSKQQPWRARKKRPAARQRSIGTAAFPSPSVFRGRRPQETAACRTVLKKKRPVRGRRAQEVREHGGRKLLSPVSRRCGPCPCCARAAPRARLHGLKTVSRCGQGGVPKISPSKAGGFSRTGKALEDLHTRPAALVRPVSRRRS